MGRKRKVQKKPRGLTATVVGGLLERRAQKRAEDHQVQMAHMRYGQEAQRFAMLQHVGQLMVLPSDEFERVVARLLSSVGYHTIQHVGGSGDLGVDLWATDPWGRTVIVQCKRKSRRNWVSAKSRGPVLMFFR